VTDTARAVASDHVADEVNWRFCHCTSVAPVFGDIVKDVTVATALPTVIVRIPAIPSTVARTSDAPAAVAVTTPPELTVTDEPADTDHATVRPVMAAPEASRGVADNAIVPPMAIDVDGAVTSTDATTAAVLVVVETTLTGNRLVLPLLPVAVTVAAPTARPVTVPVELTETTLVLLLLQRIMRLRCTVVLARSVTLSPTLICVLPSARVTAYAAVPSAPDGVRMSIGLTGTSPPHAVKATTVAAKTSR
jgi:hypothetical protein